MSFFLIFHFFCTVNGGNMSPFETLSFHISDKSSTLNFMQHKKLNATIQYSALFVLQIWVVYSICQLKLKFKPFYHLYKLDSLMENLCYGEIFIWFLGLIDQFWIIWGMSLVQVVVSNDMLSFLIHDNRMIYHFLTTLFSLLLNKIAGWVHHTQRRWYFGIICWIQGSTWQC